MNRKFIIGGAVACACLGAGPAGVASAATTQVPLQFDHAVLATPALGKAEIVSDRTKPLTVIADTDLTTGNFTVQPSNFSVPTYKFAVPAPGTATFMLNGPATGNVNPATGALTMNADLRATITIQGVGSCVKDTGPVTLSTATTQPLPGHDFPAGLTGVATGNGAFGVGWSTLNPGSGSGCVLIDSAVDGPGGFWVSRGISPVPPAIGASVKKPKPARQGSISVIKVTVSNPGNDNDTNPIRACLTAPKPLSPRRRCQTIKTLKAGAHKVLSFRVKSAKHKKGHYKLTAKVSGRGIKTVTRKTMLVVR